MKFINKVIVFVMGLVVIGVATTTINVVTQPKNVEKSVTFELLENNELAFDVYAKITKYAIIDINHASNLVNITVDSDVEFEYPYLNRSADNYYLLSNDGDSPSIQIYSSEYIIDSGLDVGDIISVTFAVEVETPIITKTLLLLIPLVLSAGLIGYIVVKKGDE